MTWQIDADRRAKGIYWQRAWSLIEGCMPVSPACDHCWAAAQAHMRAGNPNAKVSAANAGLTCAQGHFTGEVRLREDRLNLPTPRQKPAVWSVWTDLFHARAGSDFIGRAFRRMAECPQHGFLVCTKRAERMADVVSKITPLRNVTLMVTAENQEQADLRIPHLLRCEGWTLGISAEPLLGPLGLSRWLDPTGQESCSNCGADEQSFLSCAKVDAIPVDAHGDGHCAECGALRGITGYDSGIDWVTAGGESGPGARPMHPDWVRSLRDQCAAAGVSFHFKQWGEWGPGRESLSSPLLNPGIAKIHRWKSRTGPHIEFSYRTGTPPAGRLLDGILHDEFPGDLGK